MTFQEVKAEEQRFEAVVQRVVGAVVALIVAAVGIHGVIAYTVACRTRDIGLYQALGAGRSHVLRLIVGWTLRGVLIGMTAALVLLGAAAVILGP
jgi:ABC-type lipoprotein release transport system permease subunit